MTAAPRGLIGRFGLGLLLVLSGAAVAAEPPRGVIVVPFDASTLPQEEQWIGEGVAELASLGLAQHPAIVQIDRTRARAVSDPAVWTETIVRQTARAVGADAALYGRVRRDAEGLVIEPLLLNLRAGAIGSLPVMAVSDTELLPRLAALPVLYARGLHPALAADVAARIEKAARPTTSLQAFAWYARGRAAFHRGDAEAALDPLARACESDPNFVTAQYALGVAHVALGNRWKAAAQFRATILLEWGNPEAHKALGDLFLGAPRSLSAQAIEAYSQAIELRPFYANAHVGLGDARGARGDADGAIAAYRKALALDPFNALPREKLGKALTESAF